MPPADTSQIADFEKSLDELEQLVSRMEQGELSLDDSLKSFERGIALYRNCQSALEQAELRVKQLLDPSAPESAVPFDPEAAYLLSRSSGGSVGNLAKPLLSTRRSNGDFRCIHPFRGRHSRSR